MNHFYIRFNRYVLMWWSLMLLFFSHIIVYMLDSQISTVEIYSDPLYNLTYKLTYYAAIIIAIYVFTKRPRFDSAFIIATMLMVSLQLLSTIVNRSSLDHALPTILLWPLLLYDSYQLQKLVPYSVLIKKEKLLYMMIAILCICAFPLVLLHLLGEDPDGGKIFPVYFLLMFIPFLVGRKKSFARNLLIIFIAIIVIMSTKRAGIIVLLFNFSAWIIGKWRENKLTFNRLFLRLAMVFALVGSFFLVIETLDFFNINVVERFMNISEDGASGRDLIWATVFTAYSRLPVLNKLLGKGYHAVIGLNLQNRHILAHNDFIEFFYDFGVLTVLVECFLCLFLIFMSIDLYHKRSHLSKYYLMYCADFIVLALFSYFMVESEVISIWAMGLGIILADTSKNNRKKDRKCYEN